MKRDKKLKVLFVIGGYLPFRSGGTIRVEKLIKYLSRESKTECKVFTQDISKAGKYDVINEVEVIRTNPYDFSKYYIKLRSRCLKNRKLSSNKQNKFSNPKGRLIDKYFVPDASMLWSIFCCFKLSYVIKHKDIQIVYSSSPNASNHFIVYLARKIFRAKFIWITEFRDPWTKNPFRNKKKVPFEYFDHKLEAAVLKSSDSIIVTSEKYKEDFLKTYKYISANKIHFIPNGYDYEDFIFSENTIKRQNQKFIILSAGGYYEKRSLLPFIKAFELALIERPELESEIQFIHYGQIDLESLNHLQLNNNKGIIIHDAIPHSKCLEEMYNANCLLLIPGPGDGTMPGKTFEYLATGNPILALVDEGPAKRLIEDLEVGVTISTSDIYLIKKVLLNYKQELQISLNRKDVLNSISRYDRKNIAQEVLNVIMAILPKHEDSN